MFQFHFLYITLRCVASCHLSKLATKALTVYGSMYILLWYGCTHFQDQDLEKDVISKLSMVQYLSIIFEVFRVWLFKTGCYDKWAQGQAY